MRWEQHLEFKIIRLEQSVLVDHAPIRFEFKCALRDNNLVVRYSASGEEVVNSKKACWYNSHFVFEFDFEHNHRHRHRIVVRPDGTIADQSFELAMPAEEEGAVITKKLTLPVRKVDAKPGELSVSLNGVSSPVIGFNASAVLGDTPVYCASLTRNATPFDFADLYLKNIPEIKGIRFNEPEWKLNHMDLEGDERAVPVRTRFTGPDFEYKHESSSLSKVPYELDRRAKWSNPVENDATLFVEAGAWRASFPVSFDHGLIPRDRLGGGKDLQKPAPSDPDFVRKMEAYYLGKLPALRRVIDKGYWLAGDEYKIDLLSDDALYDVNIMLLKTFPDPVDYLCGLAVLLGSPVGPLHSTAFGASSAVLRPADLWAFGRGFCGTNAGLFAQMAERAAKAFNLEWKCFYAGLEGHVVPAVRWRNEFYVFDPMSGKFFYALDNTRLATLKELQEIREVSYRTDCFNRAEGNEFYFGRKVQMQEFKTFGERIFFETPDDARKELTP